MKLLSGSWALILCLLMNSGARAVEVQAAIGHPFGVARVILPTQTVGLKHGALIAATNGFSIVDDNQRVFYPAIAQRRVLGLIRELLGVPTEEQPASITVFFLFQGDEPFQITIQTPAPQTFVVQPSANPRLWQRLMRNWWQQFVAVARLQENDGDYPPLIETYLTNMLERRLELPPAIPDRRDQRRPSTLGESLQLIFNVESMRSRVMRETLRGEADHGPAQQDLPAGITWAARQVVPPPGDVSVEAIAHHIPEDCFYLRFGSFENYLWLKRFLEQNGGSVGRMATLRGHDALLSKRTQDQLGLKETVLAEILGGKIISDVALIGRDTYLREGAAIGVVFEARSGLLHGELLKQRRAAVAAWQDRGATLSEEQIDGHLVSVAATPDNRLRSFQVAVEPYHLVTNSEAIVASFLATQRGSASLAASAEFRLARQDYPLENQATVFAYLSPAFFRGLVSPQYQIELRRRLRAVTDLELTQLAQLAARHEGVACEQVSDLIAARLLPPDFADRPDDSQVVWSADEPTDSLRGARGSFLPIPDVPLQRVTPREAQEYAEVTQFLREHWTQMDPLVAQIRREPVVESGRERIEIDAEMLPFDRQKYGFVTGILGPPTTTLIRQSPRDAITAQVVVQGGPLNPSVGPHHLFFGIQDQEIPVEFSEETLLRVLQVLRTAPAYLGAWPKMGLLDLIPLGRPEARDAAGFARLPFGLWRYESPAGFSMLGFEPQVLDSASRELQVEQGANDAQIRVHIVDVSQSQIKTWFAALDFQRAYQTSVGNTRLLHAFTEQFGVPPHQALETAEKMLGVDLICALGGEYQRFSEAAGTEYWGSTHWPSLRDDGSQPGQFAAPIMAWFRGLDAEVTLRDDRATGHAVLLVEPTGESPRKLPFFDFFRTREPAR